MIRFACPGCSTTFSVQPEKAGKPGRCPKCQTQFVIPEPEPTDGTPAGPTSLQDSPPPAPPPSLSSLPPPLPPPRDPHQPVEVKPCPSCRTRLSVLPGDLGLEVECPTCKTLFQAVESDAPAPPPSRDSQGGSRLQELGAGSRDVEDAAQPRGSRRRSDDDDEDDDRPRRSRRRSDGDDGDDEDDRPRRSSSGKKPSQITAIGAMYLIGGIQALLLSFGLGAGSGGICCLWPGTYYNIVTGILCIIRGANLLGEKPTGPAPTWLSIMQIICIINFDIMNLILGIVSLVMLKDPKTQSYLDRRS